MKTLEALEFICREARRQGADRFDALAGESESIGLELFEGRVKNTEISFSRGIGIRLFVKDCPGYAFTEKFSSQALIQTVEDAVSHTRLTASLKIEIPEPAPLPSLDLGLWNPALQNIGLDHFKALGLALENKALEADKRVENVPHLGLGRSSGKTHFRNSRGADFEINGNSIYAGLGVVAAQGKSKKMGVYSNSARAFDTFNADTMAQTAVSRAIELLGAGPVKSGAFPVVLSNRISPQIFSMFSSPYYAEVVQKGQSRLEGKLGRKIASNNLTLVCNPHVPGNPGSRLFDGEGIVCTPTDVIKKGVLQTYLFNLESANRESRSSTGHATRSYSGQVGTGFSNFLVEKGVNSLEDLLSLHPRCLYVTNLEGASGCSPVSGEISIGVQGHLVENGKVTAPVDAVTISSNYFDMINGIQAISNQYSDTLSSVKVPDVLIESMHIAGS